MTRDRLPTPDDERNYDEQHAERNELAALVKEVREHKRTEWRTVDASKVLEAVRLIDAPGVEDLGVCDVCLLKNRG